MTQTLAPTLDLPPIAEPRRKRQPWFVWVAALVAVLVVALIAGLFWVDSYQPLRRAGGQFGVSGAVQSEISSVDNAYGDDYRITDPQPGDTYDVYFALTNTGPLAITIDDIAQPFNPEGTVGDPSKPDSTTAGTVALSHDAQLSDFSGQLPYTLEPGAFVQVRLSFGILDCATNPRDGLIESATTVPITYRTLGMSHTSAVDVGFAISFDSKPTCP